MYLLLCAKPRSGSVQKEPLLRERDVGSGCLDGVGINGHGVDAPTDKVLGVLRIDRWRLPANGHGHPGSMTDLDDAANRFQDGGIALVEEWRTDFTVAVHTKHELR